MKIVSWNVNGIRSCIKKGLIEFIKDEKADIYCFQEIKISAKDLEPLEIKLKTDLPNYKFYSHTATKRNGYSGVLTLSKSEPVSVQKEIGVNNIDIEGRLLLLNFKDFSLLNAYFPHTGRKLERLEYKNHFNKSILKLIKAQKLPVILTGDINVAHTENDLARSKSNKKNAGFTEGERAWFTKLLDAGYVDAFRVVTQGEGNYTWWSYMHNARERNVGWRIDYFVVDKKIESSIKKCDILQKVTGSDHCPIRLMLSKD